MTTVTPGEVREVIKTELTDENIEGLLSTATVMVAPIVVTDKVKSEIKKYLAAHLAAIKDRTTTVAEERIGDASVTYGSILTQGREPTSDLKSTHWGQTAILLDTTGYLFKLGMPPATVYAL